MTQPVEPDDVQDIIDAPDSGRLDYQSPAPPTEPSADTSAPWFGYIGLGIAIVAMLLGLASVVVAVLVFIGWTQG